MNLIHLASSLTDDEVVDVHQFASQLNSVEGMTSFEETKLRKTEKNLFFLPELKKMKSKEKRNPWEGSQELSIDPQLVLTTQNDMLPSLFMTTKPLRSSRLKHNFDQKKRKKWLGLKDVVTNQKVNIIKQAFIDKLRRNNVYSQPVQIQLEEQQKQQCFLDRKGFELKELQEKIVSIVILVNILTSIFIYSLALVFDQFERNPVIKAAEIVTTLIFLMEIIINLATIRCSLGKKLETYREISQSYKREGFYLDFANIIIVVINIIANYPPLASLRLVVVFKFSDCMQKMEKLEVYFIENYYYEQYWSLVKVLLFNFCFAHVLSIILLTMANINPDHNWMVTKGINNAHWYQQYIWGYYWGTTVMLTIGFGDIVPVTYQEACCMILVETISCMILSYNISCVGSLITNIRSQDIERSKDLKIFKKLADKHHINDDLTWKINSYIEEHVNIKKLFNIEEEMQFVEKLPTAYKVEYTKEANKVVFQDLMFFSHMMEKTLISLAEKLEKRITHPEEIILGSEQNLNLLILKNGEVGYISRKGGRSFSNIIIDRLEVSIDKHPFLLHTNFITKGKCPYAIKSIVYSVIYSLDYESLVNILRESNLDFQMYCQLRDKSQHKLDEFEVFHCKTCKTKHTKFICPKQHFMPLTQHVVDRYLNHQRLDKDTRATFQRNGMSKESCLVKYLENNEIYQRKKSEERQRVLHKSIKKERYIIDELKAVDNGHPIKHSEMGIAALERMQMSFLEKTTEIIKSYTTKMFGLDNGEDNIWQLDSDRMKNYRHYFSCDNSCNLEQRFDVTYRVKSLFKTETEVKTCQPSKDISESFSFSNPTCRKTSLDGDYQIHRKTAPHP